MEQDLSEIFEPKEFKKGDVIIHQDDETNGMYVIKSGEVEVDRDDEVIANLEEGDFFGAMGLFLHEKRSATITAISDMVSTYFLPREKFEEVKGELGEEVMEKALQRYTETYKKYIG